MKDELIAYKAFGKSIGFKEENVMIEQIAQQTTSENILVYDRIGATPMEIVKDFDPIIRGDMEAILSPRFRVINRAYNETSMDYIKFAVGCSIQDKTGRILWLRRNSPDLYGKTITGVSGHVAYDDKDEWNNHKHMVSELYTIIDANMYKEFCEELGVINREYNEEYPSMLYGYAYYDINPYISERWCYPSKLVNGEYVDFTCYMDTCQHPLYLNNRNSRRLVCNTDMYGNNPYMTFMYCAYIPDEVTIPRLESGESDKHTLEYGTLDDLIKLRKDCTTLLPQLLKAYQES